MRFKRALNFFLLLTTAMLIIAVEVTYAQDYVFRVLANKGKNSVRKVSTQPTLLKTGQKLMSDDQIVAVEDAYIGLVHQTGKTIEIRNKGTYSIRDLESKISSGPASVARRYMDFVTTKINEKGRSVNDEYRKNLRATGAVERAIGSAAIIMMIKETKNANKVYSDQITIKWDDASGSKGYLITVKNVFNEILFQSSTSVSMATVDFTEERLAKERFVIIGVKSRDNDEVVAKDFGIQRISPSNSPELTSQLVRLRNELGQESALNKVLVASFFEENKLYLDALTQYEEAMRLSPDVEDYKPEFDAVLSMSQT